MKVRIEENSLKRKKLITGSVNLERKKKFDQGIKFGDETKRTKRRKENLLVALQHERRK